MRAALAPIVGLAACIASLAVTGCRGAAREPAPAVAVTASGRAASSPEASSPETSSPETTGREELWIACECRTGPIPARVGQRPLRSRAVTIDRDGTLHTKVEFTTPPPETASRPLDAPTLARVRELARALYVKGLEIRTEEAVPDGMLCEIKIAAGPPTVTIRSAHPAKNPKLGPLLARLVELLPPPP